MKSLSAPPCPRRRARLIPPLRLAAAGLCLAVAARAATPTNPSLSSPTHAVGAWSSERRVTVEWEGAIDLSGQGLAGYSISFDTDPAGDPDVVVDVEQVVDPHAFVSDPLESGQAHWFHLRTCDAEADCAETVHLGPFWIDADEPTPPVLDSATHTPGVWSNNPVVEVSWSGASDSSSGLAGYSLAEGPDDPTVPPVFDRVITNLRTEDLVSAVGIAVGPNGDVFVADRSVSVVKRFDAEGTFLSSFGGAELSDPEALAVGADGSIYVVGVEEHEILKFDASGQFLFRWGSFGSDPGQFSSPTDVATDTAGNVYVADLFNFRVQKFDSEGTFLLEWGSRGTGDGEFDFPHKLATDSQDRIYVVDLNNFRVQKFDASGNYLLQWGSEGSGDGEFQHPYGIDVDDLGNVFVVERTDYRLQRFDASGSFLDVFDLRLATDSFFDDSRSLAVSGNEHIYVADNGTGEILRVDPEGSPTRRWGGYGVRDGNLVTVEDVVVAEDGSLYTAAFHQGRLQHLDRTGSHLDNVTFGANLVALTQSPAGTILTADRTSAAVWEYTTDGTFVDVLGGFVRPHGVDTDSQGNVYVSDELGHQVHKFDSAGNFVKAWGSFGSEPGQFNRPKGLAVNSLDQIYVVESFGGRVQKFDSDGSFLLEWGTGELSFAVEVAVDDRDLVYIGDNDRILIYEGDGTLLTTFGELGDDEGQFDLVGGLDVDPWGVVYVAELFNDRLHVFRPVSVPALAAELAHGSDPHTYTTPPLGSGADQFVRLRACDVSGRCSDPIEYGPLSIDLTGPTNPASISSLSHEPGAPNLLDAIEMEWTPADDPLSGLEGYGYDFNGDPEWSCDETADLDANATTVLSGPLAPGEWYFHLCAFDTVGNWSTSDTRGPYVVATSADLAIRGLANHDPVLAGQPLLYRLSSTNLGPALAHDAQLTATLPVGASLLGTSPSNPQCSESVGVVTCALGDLAAGVRADVHVQVLVDSGFAGTLVVDAQVASNTVVDPNVANDSMLLSTDVHGFGQARSVLDPSGSPGRLVGSLLLDPLSSRATAATSHPVTGATVMTRLLPTGTEPLDLETIDYSVGTDAHKLAVLMRLNDETTVRVLDSKTADIIEDVDFSASRPLDLAIVPDVDGDGTPDLALLAVNVTDGTAVVEIRDTSGGALISETTFATRLPIGLSAVSDFVADPNAEIAVLGIEPTTGLPELEIRDAGSGVLAAEIPLASTLLPSAHATLTNVGGAPADELVVLGRTVGATSEAYVVDSEDGTLLSRVTYSADLSPAGMVVDDRGIGGDSPTALVFGVHPPSGRAVVESRELLGGANVFDFIYPAIFVPLDGFFMPFVPPVGLPNVAYLGVRTTDDVGVVPILAGDDGALLNLITLP